MGLRACQQVALRLLLLKPRELNSWPEQHLVIRTFCYSLQAATDVFENVARGNYAV